ncbi:MAG: nitrilase [Aquificae bacterium]|nr:nitrilase [Aquificota bacterium]
MRLSTIQTNLKLGNVDKNVEKIFDFLKRAKPNSLVLLPEMWSCGFDNKHLDKHVQRTKNIYKELKKLSKEKQLVIAGTLPEKNKKGIVNKGFIIDCGNVIHRQDKVKLFKPTKEHKFFVSGNSRFDIAESSMGNLGMMICFELRFPNISYTLRRKGVEIILVPAQWGKSRKEHLEILSKARAVESQSFVVVSNTVGKIGNVEYAGASGIYSPWGETLVFSNEEEGLFETEVDLADIYKVRKKIKMDY